MPHPSYAFIGIGLFSFALIEYLASHFFPHALWKRPDVIGFAGIADYALMAELSGVVILLGAFGKMKAASPDLYVTCVTAIFAGFLIAAAFIGFYLVLPHARKNI